MSEGHLGGRSAPRRGRGRPNRQHRGSGGGGPSRGGSGTDGERGGRSRGRGRASRGASRGGRGGGTQKKAPGGGGFSRKGGNMAADMGYDGDAVLMARETYKPEQSYSRGSSGRGRAREVVKVPMQRLHMTSDNQEMVKDMLKDLHLGDNYGSNEDLTGDDLDFRDDLYSGADCDGTEEQEYDELDWRAADQYWLSDSKLVVEETRRHALPGLQDQPQHAQKHTQQYPHSVVTQNSSIGLNKLQRYGFDKSRCEKALTENDGDIGRSLEALLSECFQLKFPKPPLEPGEYITQSDAEEDEPNGDVALGDDTSWEDILEQRNEEMFALSSIYNDKFSEVIHNQVWVISLELPYLNTLAKNKVDSKRTKDKQEKAAKQKWQEQDLCHFYRRGNCRFGSRCRHRHAVAYKDTMAIETSGADAQDFMYNLEVRFPQGNRYPYEVPFVALYSTNPCLDYHVCLNLTTRLLREAKDVATDGLPVVFTLVSILESDEEIKIAFDQKPSKFSLPEPIIHRSPVQKQPKLTKTVPENNETAKNSKDQDKVSGKPVAASYKDREPVLEDGQDEDEKKEDMRKRYMRKEPAKPVPSAVQIDKNNKRLKDKFKQIQERSSYKDMWEARKSLPAWTRRKDILSALMNNQVLVVSGATGCGKTTQVPQFILDHYLGLRGASMCNIVCTQPRRLSAMAVAERVAQERSEKISGIVGYQIRMESMMSTQTRLLFCTTGILLRRLEGDPKLNTVTHIIIDEVHERSEESDFLMLILRDMLPWRPDLKVILMSATLNADLFSNYFNGCPVIDIPGRTFPVDQYFLEDVIEMTGFMVDERSPLARPLKRSNAVHSDQKSTRESTEDIDRALDVVGGQSGQPPKDNIRDENLTPKQLFLRYADYKKKTVKCMAMMDHEKINSDLIEELIEWIIDGQHKYPKDGAILVFLPGMAEITTVYEQLQGNARFGSKHRAKFKLVPLHSTLSTEDQQTVFSRSKPGVVKIVLATNIAETSITIDDVVFVIDAGRMKEKRYDTTKGMESLDTVWVSRANAMQRKGRAGRVAAGAAFHLFTSCRYHCHLSEQPVPEIQRAPLEQIVLRIKLLEVFKLQEVEAVLGKIIESPDEDNVRGAMNRLENLGALDENKELTPLGYHLASLPVDVRIGKLMLFGAIFQCLDPALTIAATLSYKSPFVSPFNKKEEATSKKLEFAVGNSDHLTMLKAYQAWMKAAENSHFAAYRFCQDNFLSIKTLQMLGNMKRQFVELLSDIGFVHGDLTAKRIERSARKGSDGVSEVTGYQANNNSDNMKLVAAILVAALYPNVVQVLRPENKYTSTGEGAVPKMPRPEELKFKTKSDGYVNVHPSSVNFQVRHYESPYLVYHEKVKTSRVYIRDCTMVSVYPLLLFGGNISIDLDRGQFVTSVDEGWIRFLATSHQVAELVRELRLELDHLMRDKIEKPDMDLCASHRGSRIISTIVKLITTQ